MAPEKWMKLEDFFVSFRDGRFSGSMLVSWRVLTGMILQVAPYDFILKLLGSCLRRQVAARLCNEVSTDATPCRRELEKHKDWCSEVKIPGSLNYQYWADQNGIKQRKSIMLRSFPSKIKPCLSWCDIMPPVIRRNWRDTLGDQFLTTDWNGTCLLFQSSNLLGQNWAIPAIILHKSFCLHLSDGIPTTPKIGYIHALCPVFYSVWSVFKPPFVW